MPNAASSGLNLGGTNRLLLHPEFKQTITALKEVRVALPRSPVEEDLYGQDKEFAAGQSRLTRLEAAETYPLDAARGEFLMRSGLRIAAYDESINRFSALEGTAFLTSHSLTVLDPDRYVPVLLLTLYFYSRSKYLAAKTGKVRYSETPQMESQIDYMKDKIMFLLRQVPSSSLLFIDGPLIAGDVYVRLIGSIGEFHSREIFPIFFVKNSDSSLITDSTPDLSGRFNSDLHWANELLDPGERTPFYKYTDLRNPSRNAKVFCYFKSLRAAPTRIEFHVDTFERYLEQIPAAMDLVQYLMLVQGDQSNPQIRPIAVAEKFARAGIALFDLDSLVRSSGLQPTMNQERFAW